jgi:predicted nucleotidyltransferase
LAERLAASGIDYMVIGGQAVLMYGEPRLTRDIDITLGLDASAFGMIVALAEELGLRIIVENPEEFVQRTMVLPAVETETGVRVDFIFSNSEYERQALARTTFIDVEGTKVRFATIEDVVIHKLVAGRERDIEDVRSILRRHHHIDVVHVRDWLRQFDQTLAIDASARFDRLLRAAGT